MIKAKKNTYVAVQWIDMNHMKKDNNRAYFSEPVDMVEQFSIGEFLTFHMDFTLHPCLVSFILLQGLPGL